MSKQGPIESKTLSSTRLGDQSNDQSDDQSDDQSNRFEYETPNGFELPELEMPDYSSSVPYLPKNSSNFDTNEMAYQSTPSIQTFKPMITNISSMISGQYQYPQSSSLIQNHFEDFASNLEVSQRSEQMTSQFSRYQDLGLLGKGGMGEVRRVLDRDLNRSVAMKIIHQKFTNQRGLMARFIEEAQTTAGLQHPNLVPILDFGALIDQRFYFTMPEIKGQTLRDVIQKLHKLSTERLWGEVKEKETGEWHFRSLIQAFKTICDAVGYAHDHNVIHRDLKPENIMLGTRGEVLVLDWGVAKKVQAQVQVANDENTDPKHFENDQLKIENQVDFGKEDQAYEKIPEADLQTSQVDDKANQDEFAYLETYIPQEPIDLSKFSSDHAHSSGQNLFQATLDSSHQTLMGSQGQGRNHATQSSQSSSSSSQQHKVHDSYLGLSSHKTKAELLNTQFGTVVGTLSYMAPEQLAGYLDQISYEADVYCLGGILFEILTGAPPFPLKKSNFDFAKADEDRKQIKWKTDSKIPLALKEIAKKALSYERADRFANANEMATEVEAWLTGAKQREKALEYVQIAQNLDQKASKLKEVAILLEKESLALSKTLKPWSDEKEKLPYWQKQQHCKEAKLQAELHIFEAEQALQASLLHDPYLEEAHLALALRYQEKHALAEKQKNQAEIKRYELFLKDQISFLSKKDQEIMNAYLNPNLEVKIEIDVDEEVDFYWIKERLEYKRLVRKTPIRLFRRKKLEQVFHIGTHILQIEHAQYETVVYPIEIQRGIGFPQIAPSQTEAQKLKLIPKGKLPANMAYIPAGWFECGGDQQNVSNSPSARKLWLDGYFIQKRHVTHREYLLFLNDLVAQNQKELAFQYAPKNKKQDHQNHFKESQKCLEMITRADWQEDFPITYVNYWQALAYCEWLSKLWQIRVRLPLDCEWEKAARGIDGRIFPWGDEFDPTWCRMRQSQEVLPSPARDFDYPIDQSVYGVFGMAGNCRDWCLDTFQTEYPFEPNQRVENQDVVVPRLEEMDLSISKVVRGGCWKGFEGNCRLAFRFMATSSFSDDDGSFRVAFSLKDLENHFKS
jgi:serine/threonine-protein kinase